uniref:ZP domain-containing protein n=1 Tax=Ascaris lumbricoides TaxID=6252 RepID=A0A0M3I0A9_ASCLU
MITVLRLQCGFVLETGCLVRSRRRDSASRVTLDPSSCTATVANRSTN